MRPLKALQLSQWTAPPYNASAVQPPDPPDTVLAALVTLAVGSIAAVYQDAVLVVVGAAFGAAGTPGWVCTTGGTPGTWKAMSNLA